MAIERQGATELPQVLQIEADRYSGLLSQTSDDPWQGLSQVQSQQVKSILGLSDYVAGQICRHPQWLTHITAPETADESSHYLSELAALLAQISDENAAKKCVRDFRNRWLVTLAYRDFLSLTALETSLQDISALAEALIIASRDWVFRQLTAQYGTPCDTEGNPQHLLILGMGKLGGRELNFSSDIDLIFVFPEHGETRHLEGTGGRRTLDNQQFFTRMGQKLVNLLDQVTMDGFVFRVDMRLRPYGDSGPLVVSSHAFEDYYQEQGRDWERYAMVKARVLGPSTPEAVALQEMLRPFVYRRYIDFSAIEALRKMKQMISREVRRRQLSDNIKLGPGGIREVEFVVQSFQLIRGGREPSLRTQSIYGALDTLKALGQLDAKAIDELKSGYSLLRRVENLLQAIDDKQTQTLPGDDGCGVRDWQRLCLAMGEESPESLRSRIDNAMADIHRHFKDTVGGDEEESEKEHWTATLWHEYEDDEARTMLSSHGINDEKLWPVLSQWRENTSRKSIGPRGRDTLDRLMPKLLEDLFAHKAPCEAFAPVSRVLDQILTRTTYLELLCENPGARQQLISLCCISPWIATQLARFPMLLDELIDPVQLYDTTSLDDYPSELRLALLRVPEDDMEQQMEALRQFKLSQQLKIAAADVTGILPIMQVSDHLTYLAQAIIEQVVQQAWQQVAARHGVPAHLTEGEMGFAVVGYGKLGGIELGYGSDLDLVFLHNAPAGVQTNGDRQIDASHFYLKLAQRILHLFSTRTVSGELYEVDMRLRPSGSSGLLVSEIENFGEYQANEAWTWEHQALVRSRLVYGGQQLAERFRDIRHAVLSQARDADELAKAVRDMRSKMREHLLKVKEGEFDLKQSSGGIADIEFIAQYLVLANSHANGGLTAWSDNVRIFEDLAELEILPAEEAEGLIHVYCLLRDESHRLTLQGLAGELPKAQVEEQAELVEKIYSKVLGQP
ncbi:bifunctional [glutamate--ammonia ligase]-adenylyl-L-tyrosine phosphorylase/[glutamate--ammonia-ligase] adenylyltransferase [Shewanella submarina]|uniref:Bifunctional glutamine synthetase adenylyltransferase/adenylyl-removing enzyme n=1 Tax=Shewanella submarina TaxID=2016376 RepID=A0ABV7GDW6_9GAMM|nr:bifunctional [glutamate--ammonia ligase]-adenylyl-L-tyrosine phosphorylase/[glutamate--ammonia-ligase] adenylyltransferase [Shewanella submarina]MCL1037394.1 bifunctional [glutamate--ammonia ligase]-adenylyl-L-tyrosine phosphorylase/[glutamate--ammonia-ligase] adenylyltransferase [Shewanella submarina]